MIIEVTIKPNAKESIVEILSSEKLLVCLKSAPIDGKANSELIRLLSKHFHVPQKSILIKRGITAKKKIIEIVQ